MVTVVLTGSIGSGKTQVCKYLASKSFPVYSCDDRAKALYEERPELLDAVGRVLGVSVRRSDGSTDREAIAREIFSDKEKLLAVEALVHPGVYEDFVAWRNACSSEIVVMESAIFLQKPMFHPLADYVINVVSPPEQIIRRIMSRDRVDRETAEHRFVSQETATDRLPDATIVNDRDLETLYLRVDEVMNGIKEKFNIKMKTDLAKILTVSGQHGLCKYIAQAKNGIIVESLADGQRTALSNRSRVNTLADISIYTSEGELKLHEVFLSLREALGSEAAPSSKAPADQIKALFAKAVPNYDEDRFYVSHMKKVLDWYGELDKYASFDFMTDEEREAEAAAGQTGE